MLPHIVTVYGLSKSNPLNGRIVQVAGKGDVLVMKQAIDGAEIGTTLTVSGKEKVVTGIETARGAIGLLPQVGYVIKSTQA